MKTIKTAGVLNQRTMKWIVAFMIIHVITTLLGPFLVPLYFSYLTPQSYGKLTEYEAYVTLIELFLRRGVYVIIGIFLLKEAKSVGYHRTFWCCLGIVFGLIALLFFYVYRIYEHTKPKDESNSALEASYKED